VKVVSFRGHAQKERYGNIVGFLLGLIQSASALALTALSFGRDKLKLQMEMLIRAKTTCVGSRIPCLLLAPVQALLSVHSPEYPRMRLERPHAVT
jgi:hypothetical protein